MRLKSKPTVVAIALIGLTFAAPALESGTIVEVDAIIRNIIANPASGSNEFFVALRSSDVDNHVVRLSGSGVITGVISEPTLGDPYGLAISPDGDELYVTWPTSSKLRVYDLPSLNVISDADLPTFVLPESITVSATRIYVATGSDRLAILDRSTLELLYLGQPPGARLSAQKMMRLTPDGTRLLAVNDISRPILLDITGDAPVTAGYVCSKDWWPGSHFSFSPDGTRLYTGGRTVMVFNVREEGLLHQIHDVPIGGREIGTAGATLSPDGHYLYTRGPGLEVVTIDTTKLLPIRTDPTSGLNTGFWGMAVSTDGTTLAVPIDFEPGATAYATAVELIDVSSPTPEIGGVRARVLDSIESRPFRIIDTTSIYDWTDHLNISDGDWGRVDLLPGNRTILFHSGSHIDFTMPAEIIAGEWDDLGELVMQRDPGSGLLDPNEICVEEPMTPGETETVTIHGRNFMNGVAVVERPGYLMTPVSSTDLGWATMSATFEVDPDHGPGMFWGSFEIQNPGGELERGYHYVTYPDISHVGFEDFTVEVDEDAGSASIAVERRGNNSGIVTVDYATSDWTATSGISGDYTETTGTLTWIDGDSAPKYITVPIEADLVPEAPETFRVQLSNVIGDAVISGDRAETTIIDNRSSEIAFTTPSSSFWEDAGTLSLQVTRSGWLDADASVFWQTIDDEAVAGEDYVAGSGTFTWAPGEGDTKTIEVTILDDVFFEPDERFQVRLSSPTGNAYLGDWWQHQALIKDDDIMAISVQEGTQAVAENVGLVVVTVTRSGGDNAAVTVDYDTVNGTALAGSDYTATSGVLSWSVGDTGAKTIQIPITNDSLAEAAETMSLELSNPTGGAILGAPSSSDITILDDDGSLVKFQSSSHPVAESGGSVEVFVDRIGSDVAGAVSVDFATANATATAGSDYLPVSGTMTWIAGDTTSKSFTVTILEDGTPEGPESIELNLSNLTGDAVLGTPSTAHIVITDNDSNETNINTVTSGPQTSPDVAMNASGNAIVVWESYDQDGSGWGVYGQRFHPTGAAFGGEIQINGTTAGDQRYPAVAMAADGGFTVVWQGTDADGAGIGGRRFTAAGSPVAADFTVNTGTSGDQGRPDIAIDGTGAAMVVWQSDNGGSLDIRGRAYNAAGAPLGAEFPVNTTTADDQQLASVAGSAGGGFAVAWQTYGQDGPANGIAARRFSSTGAALTTERLANQWTTGHQIEPAVAHADDGSFLVSWEDTVHQDGWGSSVRARWFDAAATPVTDDIQVNTYWNDDQGSPALTCTGDGRIMSAWESMGQDGFGLGVFAQAMNAGGAAVGGEIPINSHVSDAQHRPAVAASDHGFFWVVWASGAQDGSGDGVYGLFGQLPAGLRVFADGFESGDANAWSNALP